jgi:hypothetical protein
MRMTLKFTDYSPPKDGTYVVVGGKAVPASKGALTLLAMNAMLLSRGDDKVDPKSEQADPVETFAVPC